MNQRRDEQGLRPPQSNALGPDKRTKHHETQAHANQVRQVTHGQDSVAGKSAQESAKGGFEPDLLMVRSWLEKRPMEPNNAKAAMIPYPRQWATKRGRYCKFRAPGAGTYALIRARPTF
ncbi:MAG: hypothetical protein CMH60_03745 [Myxococcales bacterium]|nr:hypothetical protein [Myxococcales bacterium]